MIAWSPLAGGVLTGKYSRADLAEQPAAVSLEGRKDLALAHGRLTERGLAIADVVKEIAAQLGKKPSQVALAWSLQNPDVTAPIVGARTTAQLEDNLGALEWRMLLPSAGRWSVNGPDLDVSYLIAGPGVSAAPR